VSSSDFLVEEELDLVVFVLSSSFLVDEELGFVVVVAPPWLEDVLLPVVVTLALELVEVASVVAVEEEAEEEADEEVAGPPLPGPAVFQ
jgi:hypothetical protein